MDSESTWTVRVRTIFALPLQSAAQLQLCQLILKRESREYGSLRVADAAGSQEIEQIGDGRGGCTP